MNTTSSLLLGGLAGLVIGLFLVPMWYGSFMMPERWQGGMMPMGGMMGMNMDIDLHFIEMMIPHHDGAITMAELALDRGEHPELRSLAGSIIEEQTAENELMRQWYKEWTGVEVPENIIGSVRGMTGHQGAMGMRTMMEGDMEVLASAEDFDVEFILQMIPHHEMAVMMAQMLAAGTERAEMKGLAEQIIESQTQEIELMRGWYQEWTR